MAGQIIDGVAAARKVRAEIKTRVETLKRRGVQPGLAAVLVGDSPASQLYVRNKSRACDEVGLHAEVHRFPADATERAVLECIRELNANPRIHGILVQLPLPRHFDTQTVVQAVAVDKDVDGFNWCNLGALLGGTCRFAPCTPSGVMRLLDENSIAIAGTNAVVVGRSVIVGRPMAMMLLARDATVSICTSKTRNLDEYTKLADILVVATGRPGLITAPMVKAGAAVIDVGITRTAEGRFAGDIDFDGVRRKAAYLTPVPGGVGPMTVAMLLANTVTAAERFASAAVPR